ncbi:carbon-nitrogen hydrolase [Planctomycetales bacterium ZRK34]|nr:carbon-nitrogen hydrolase [Planctomycetales bacterium ZRK34]
MSKDTIKIALIQHACGTDSATNVNTFCDMATEAAKQGAELIVTQELFASQYFCQVEDESRFDLAEPIPGPTSQRMCELARSLGVAVSASLFEKRAAGMYHNTSIMVDRSGEIIDRYRKMHIPDDPRFYEKYYFTPGDLGFRVQQLPGAGVTTGMLVCWDQWFPEAARLTAMQGAQLLLYPTAIGWYHGETEQDKADQLAAWQTIQKSHAVANGVYVAACNRVGVEDDLTFWGHSFIIDPAGHVIAEAPQGEPAILTAELDLSRIDTQRRGWPFLRDRRIDAYQPLTQRLLDQ